MDRWQSLVEQEVASDRAWLRRQPGMDSPDAVYRLSETMCGWVAEYSADWWKGSAAAASATGGGPPWMQESLQRLWRVWRHHWQDALQASPGAVDGWEVAAAVIRGLGYRKLRTMAGTKTATPGAAPEAGESSPLARGNLGGNPLHDSVLVAAVVQQDSDAIEYLRSRFVFIPRRIARVRGTRFDPDDWDAFLNCWIAEGRLAGYQGQAGLSRYLGTAYAREQYKTWRRSLRVGAEPLQDQHLADLAAPEQSLAAQDEIDHCSELLTQLIHQGFQRLKEKEQWALFGLHRLQLLAKAVAVQLGVSEGQFSRIQKQAHEKLSAWVLDRLHGPDDQAVQCRDCLYLLARCGRTEVLVEMMGRVLDRLESPALVSAAAPSKTPLDSLSLRGAR